MKRSTHVALLVGGLSVAGAGAFAMIPPRTDCKPVAPPAAAAQGTSGRVVLADKPGVASGETPAAAAPTAAQPQNCRRPRWFSTSTSSSGYRRSGGIFFPGWSNRTERSGNIGFTQSRQSTRSRSTTSRSSTSSRSTTSRGGFGSTGRSVGRSSS